MKVTVDAKTKKILEGAILGINGDEVVQSFLAVMLAAIHRNFAGDISPSNRCRVPANLLERSDHWGECPLCSTQSRR
jgi:hypothetical protein